MILSAVLCSNVPLPSCWSPFCYDLCAWRSARLRCVDQPERAKSITWWGFPITPRAKIKLPIFGQQTVEKHWGIPLLIANTWFRKRGHTSKYVNEGLSFRETPRSWRYVVYKSRKRRLKLVFFYDLIRVNSRKMAHGSLADLTTLWKIENKQLNCQKRSFNWPGNEGKQVLLSFDSVNSFPKNIAFWTKNLTRTWR